MADENTPPPANQPAPSGADAMAEAALKAARDAISGIGDLADQAASPVPAPAPQARAHELPALTPALSPTQAKTLGLLSDVNLNVKIELGRARMLVEDVLKLAEGAVVELDKLAGDPVDVYVNDQHVARGEVLVLNDNFCVRINEILAPVAAVPPAAKSA